MEIVSLIEQQLHAGVISLLAFAPIWLISLNNYIKRAQIFMLFALPALHALLTKFAVTIHK